MILIEVFNLANFEDVYKCLADSYDEKITTIKEKVRKGFDQIRGLKPIKLNEKYLITIGVCKEEDSNYYDVSGVINGDEDFYSLVFDEWENWISYEVDTTTLKNFSYSEIAAHCIWEMTWTGWTIEDRKAKIELEDREGKIEKRLEKEKDEFIQNNCTITDTYLNDLIEQYAKAKTNDLQASIEIIIEELIEKDLILSHHIKIISQEFDDEDIMIAIQDLNRRGLIN